MSAPERELSASVTINADQDRVWSVLTDPRMMPAASPELLAVTRLRRGPLRAGETFVGWNRRKAVIWPTINTITVLDRGRQLSWHTRTSGAVWTYTLTRRGDSTVVHERRRVPGGVPVSARWFADALLGGLGRHTEELDAHLSQTLEWLRKAAERRPSAGADDRSGTMTHSRSTTCRTISRRRRS